MEIDYLESEVAVIQSQLNLAFEFTEHGISKPNIAKHCKDHRFSIFHDQRYSGLVNFALPY